MNKLSVVLILLVVLIYIRFNLKYNEETEIVQVRPSQLTPALLYERNPIVLEGSVVSTKEIVKKSMRYLYIYSNNVKKDATEKVEVNRSRFAVIQPAEGEAIINIINPKYKGEEDYPVLPIKLRTTQALVLPMYWMFYNERPINIAYVHDTFSTFYHTFKSII
jgi:hypothetical protein